MISKIYKKLSVHSDLTPSPEINNLFSKLVEYVLDYNGISEIEAVKIVNKELNAKEILNLQKICAEGEAELEKYWAKLIGQGVNLLKDFPYYQNYIDLSELEIKLLDSGKPGWDKSPVLFMGGGALPMTAIILAYLRKVKSTIVDVDGEAVLLAKQVIDKLGLGKMIKMVQMEGENFEGYGDFPVIYVAALAGVGDKSKRSIFQKISESVGEEQLLLARSSWGVREVLYRPLPDMKDLGLEQILKFDPRDGIVNSVVLLKKIHKNI